jgi:hypothetical protein
MVFVEIAWPPGDIGKTAGKLDHMLAGAATGLNGVPGFTGKESLQDGTDRLVVTMEGRRVEPTVCLKTAAILAKFNHIVSHSGLPELRAIGPSL